MQLLKSKKQFKLSESGQQISVRFAMCRVEGEDIQMLNPWFKCRDYFSDWLIATRLGVKYMSIHGFTPDGKDNPIPLDSLTLAIESDAKSLNHIKENLGLLAKAQGENISAPEILYDGEFEGSPALAIRFDKVWLVTTQHLALLTLLIRYLSLGVPEKPLDLDNFLQALIKNFDGFRDTDTIQQLLSSISITDFLRATGERYEEILEITSKLLAESEPSVSELHGYGGIYSFARDIREKAFKYSGGTKYINKVNQYLLGLVSETISA